MDSVQCLTNELAEHQIDSILVTSKSNVYYVSNYYTDPHERVVAVFIDKLDEPILLLPEMEREDAIASGWTGKLLTYYDHENPIELFRDYLMQEKRIPMQLGVEKDHLTIDRFEQLQTILQDTSFVDGRSLLANLRVVKSEDEYSIMKQAATLADFGIKTGIEALKQGTKEIDIVAEIEYALKKQGVSDMSFSTIVVSGTKTASPHGNPSEKKIEAGDFVLFDLGVVWNGYCSDITRTVAYKRINQQQEAIYNTVLRAQEKAIDAAAIGRPVSEIDKAARQHIEQQGYGKYFTHRIGHGIGIDVHEFPSMSSNNHLPLQNGMCFTIEPGIYVPGVGGVRIEDEVIMTDNGAELLTAYPKTLQIVDE